MTSVSQQRTLHQIHAERQRKRWKERTWRYITGVRPRNVRGACRALLADIKATWNWLVTPREDLP